MRTKQGRLRFSGATLLERNFNRFPTYAAPETIERDAPGVGLTVAIDAVFEIGAADQPGIAERLRRVRRALAVHHAIEAIGERLAVEPAFDEAGIAGATTRRGHNLGVQH